MSKQSEIQHWITALRHDTIHKLARKKVIQPGLFDTWGLASVTGDDFPGERLLVCFNPMVAAERRRQRDLLLELTEAEAARLAAGYAAGHYDRDALGDEETVRAYKSLARVERAFRSMKSLLAVRPVFHWKGGGCGCTCSCACWPTAYSYEFER